MLDSAATLRPHPDKGTEDDDDDDLLLLMCRDVKNDIVTHVQISCVIVCVT